MLGNSKRYLGIVIAVVSMGGVSQAISAEAKFSQGQIYALESALYGAGYSIKKVDGVLDSATKKAIKKFQQDDPKLLATGKINAKVLASLGIDAAQSFDSVETATQAAEEVVEASAVVPPVVKDMNKVMEQAKPVAKVEVPVVEMPAKVSEAKPTMVTAKPPAKAVVSAKAIITEEGKATEEKKGWFW